jgi:hypothetical protein
MKSTIGLLFIFTIVVAIGCGSRKSSSDYLLTPKEKTIFDSLQLDTTIMKDIRASFNGEVEPFHYSLGKIMEGDKEVEADPIYQKGLVLEAGNVNATNLVISLKDILRKKGYSIFLLENNFNIENKLDRVGILQTIDKYEVLKQVGTDGINYNITNDSLITIIKDLDKKYSLELIGASGDWCEFFIHNDPPSWTDFGNEIYKICPDIVDQGAGSIEAMVEEVKKTKRLYFWWD